MKLTDAGAKEILRAWPERTKSLWKTPTGKGYWLRASPTNGGAKYPHLSSPGTTAFLTNPDGLYVYFHEFKFCDVICIESCGTSQNLNDKRSRYMLASHSVLLSCTAAWMFEDIVVQSSRIVSRWQAARTFPRKPQNRDLVIPVRLLRVLYALEDTLYAKWKANHVPTGYEYYCRHSSLKTHTSQRTRRFLRGMSLQSHFLTIK
jgi:hypothetical protein